MWEDGRKSDERRRRRERLSCVSSYILSQYPSLWGGEERRDWQHFLPLPGAGEGLPRVQRGGAMMHPKNDLCWWLWPLASRLILNTFFKRKEPQKTMKPQMIVEQIHLSLADCEGISVLYRDIFICRFPENLWSIHTRNFNSGKNSWRSICFVSYNLKCHVNSL